jgi:site-specific DNA recombinase
MKRAVGYVRVSSKEQREEGYSIPAQRKLLEEYAKREGFTVVEWFEEAETAKQVGRTEFGRMLKLLKAKKDVRNILVEKTDRLYRNITDWVKIDELSCEVHFVKENEVMGPGARAGQKFVHGVRVLMAKNYSENLSEETRKGMGEKAAQGLWPTVAPLGYLNDKSAAAQIVIDWPRARIMRGVFERYGSGEMSIRGVTQWAFEEGLRSKKGNRVGTSAIRTYLQHPVYAGCYNWNGKTYEARHDAIIPFSLFEQVQKVMHSPDRPRPKNRHFAFRGLLKCGVCGCSITGEIKKEKYVYYRCTRMRGNCHELPIREDELARQLGEPLKRLRITPERQEWIVEALKASHADEKKARDEELRQIRKEEAELRRKINAVYEDKLSGAISTEMWERKHAEYSHILNRLVGTMAEHRFAEDNYLATGVRVLELSNRAYQLYIEQDHDEQAKLIRLIASNCTLKDNQVHVGLKEVFAILADGVAKEAEMEAAGASKEAIEKEWLPG